MLHGLSKAEMCGHYLRKLFLAHETRTAGGPGGLAVTVIVRQLLEAGPQVNLLFITWV